MKENFGEEIIPEEIEIIHQIGSPKTSNAESERPHDTGGDDGYSLPPQAKPRLVTVKKLSNKTEMRLLLK